VEPIPTSFGIFFKGNGYTLVDWTPAGSSDDADWELPRNLEAFAALKNDMTFITGLDMLDAQFKGHGWGVVYVLAGRDGNLCTLTSDIDRDRSKAFETSVARQYEPTIDQIIADAIHTNEPFKSLETGVLPYNGYINMGTVGDNLAHRAPNDFLPPERDPTKLFNKAVQRRTAWCGGGLRYVAERHLQRARTKRARRGARGRETHEGDRRDFRRPAHRAAHGEHSRPRAAPSGYNERRRSRCRNELSGHGRAPPRLFPT
jgi:hypothetical protein